MTDAAITRRNLLSGLGAGIGSAALTTQPAQAQSFWKRLVWKAMGVGARQSEVTQSRNGRLRKESVLYVGGGAMSGIAWSSDGKYLALTDRRDDRGMIGYEIIDYDSGKTVQTVAYDVFGYRWSTTDVRFSPDGNYLATLLAVWDVRSGALVLKFVASGLTFTPDSKFLICCSVIIGKQSWITFYETGSWRVARRLTLPPGSNLECIAMHPSGSFMVTLGTILPPRIVPTPAGYMGLSSELQIWSPVDADQPPRTFPPFLFGGPGFELTFSPDGKQLALNALPTARVYDFGAAVAGQLKERELLSQHTLTNMGYSHDGSLFMASAINPHDDIGLACFDAHTLEVVDIIDAPNLLAHSVRLHPTRKLFALILSGTDDGAELSIWSYR